MEKIHIKQIGELSIREFSKNFYQSRKTIRIYEEQLTEDF